MDVQSEFGQDVMLSFLFQFNQFEKALRKAGFMKPGRPNEADWRAFISKIDKVFDKKVDVVLEASVDYILVSKYPGGRPFAVREISLLADQIQGLGKRLARSIHFQTPTNEEEEMMIASMVIMAAWHELI